MQEENSTLSATNIVTTLTLLSSKFSSTRCERCYLTWQVLATQEQISSLSDGINFVLRYYPCLTVEEGAYILQPNSWTSLWVMRCPYLTHKPQTEQFCSSYSYTFTMYGFLFPLRQTGVIIIIIIIHFTALHKWWYKRFGEREVMQIIAYWQTTPTTGVAEELLSIYTRIIVAVDTWCMGTADEKNIHCWHQSLSRSLTTNGLKVGVW